MIQGRAIQQVLIRREGRRAGNSAGGSCGQAVHFLGCLTISFPSLWLLELLQGGWGFGKTPKGAQPFFFMFPRPPFSTFSC